MEMLKDILLVLGRIITILPLLLGVTIFMGKRAIGELPVFDFLIVLTLGSVVGADIADPNVKHLPTAIAIIGIGLLERFVAHIKLTNRKIGRALTFEPTIVIKDGQFLRKNMKKIRYSIDNILLMLRQNDVFYIEDVALGIIEANGKLSVFRKAEKDTPNREDFGILKQTDSIPLPIIIDGKLYKSVLTSLQVDEAWLIAMLRKQGVNAIDDVFFASLTENLSLYVTLNDNDMKLPPLYQ
ncbi:DUF421 domain-containing protein [Paraliobacillus sediminis]|uniref:DUF421 domain-containing protein n=1 Tax=Paraliobacillus sediminis TaxID=1885916 RepID=UPI000E3E3AE7|nr:DUF421 domain-containing protein [Paraliobacillus sediminis]